MRTAAIIPVAGRGKRLASDVPKQFLDLSGKPVIYRTLQQILQVPQINTGVVVTTAEDIDKMYNLLSGIPGFTQRFRVIAGGDERQDSVYNGLQALVPDTVMVLVHDGVRPLVSPEIIRHSIAVAAREGGCVAAVPVKDTIKKATGNKIIETIPRENLWQIQTPQTFRYEILMEAHLKAKGADYYGTDEASLVEWSGHPVMIVEGSNRNIKITTAEDLIIARALYQEQVA
jgi:2-C-methyl-D-erythritol 4-phosphate cytidylyltransferase